MNLITSKFNNNGVTLEDAQQAIRKANEKKRKQHLRKIENEKKAIAILDSKPEHYESPMNIALTNESCPFTPNTREVGDRLIAWAKDIRAKRRRKATCQRKRTF